MAFALAALPLPALAHPAGVFEATLPETEAGLRTLADCETAIAPLVELRAKPRGAKHSAVRGSRFNRAAGNTTRCEMIDGEPLIVVIPKAI